MDYGMVLHTYFLQKLLFAIPFLIAFIITLIAYGSAPKAVLGALDYILIGFLLGFLLQIISGTIFAYIVQQPLLPLKLRQEGLGFEEIARITSGYNILSLATNLVILLVSLTLVGYGVYELVNIAKNVLKTSAQ